MGNDGPNMIIDRNFQPDIEALLCPIAGELPAGPSMRYDPQYTLIRNAREEEDARLPMREWARPLKKADWRVVADNATTLLQSRSKDFQVAGWLCEAWIHQHQLHGFNAAVQLLTGMVERYWENAHPQIEEDDDEARVAPFFWMNEHLPHVLLLQIPILILPERMPSAICTFDWDQALALENQPREAKKGSKATISPIPTRAEIVSGAQGENLLRLIENADLLTHAIEAWGTLDSAITKKMGTRGQSIAKVKEMLQKMQRVCTTLIDGREVKKTAPSDSTPPGKDTESSLVEQEVSETAAAEQVETSANRNAESDHHMGPITSREEAYRTLEEIALFLQKTEPHSPTPYLIQRAVSWGRMSLTDLMQEVLTEEGDMTRFFSMLGIKGPKE